MVTASEKKIHEQRILKVEFKTARPDYIREELLERARSSRRWLGKEFTSEPQRVLTDNTSEADGIRWNGSLESLKAIARWLKDLEGESDPERIRVDLNDPGVWYPPLEMTGRPGGYFQVWPGDWIIAVFRDYGRFIAPMEPSRVEVIL